ncbi:MAG: phosphotransferase [Aestuariivita sp.]|nr:phosphotransferase [Aestuariivita sp.]
MSAAENNLTMTLRAISNLGNVSEDIVEIPPMAHPINRGLGGSSFLVRVPEGSVVYFVKKVSDVIRASHDFSCMVKMAQQSSSLSLTPTLLDSDEAQGLMVFEGLPDTWKYGTTKAFRDPDISNKAAIALKAIHGTEALSKTFTPFDRIRLLVEELDAFAAQNGKRVYPEYFHTMLDWVSRTEMAIKAAGTDLTPCKGENNLSDFMIGQDGDLRLVDFDQAANGDPYSDLGTLANEYCRTDEDVSKLVEDYEGSAIPSVVARVKLYVVVSAFQLGLWGLVSHLRVPETEIEYQKYGQNQLLYCRSAISRWNIGRLLRDI